MKELWFATVLLLYGVVTAAADPLPSWHSGDAKERIVEFVERVTDPSGPHYVTPAQRIAVFDNDGTLWSEQPFYFQFLFAMDRVAELAAEDPSVLTSAVLKAAAAGDIEGALADGEEGLIEILVASHSGLTVAEFQAIAADWLTNAKHPSKATAYKNLVFQPMLELLGYLRDEGFSTYIVSGGGIHFIRSMAEEVYGIPPEHVIGSTGNASYRVIDGEAVIMKDPGVFFVDDKEGKPVAIDRKIGRKPILVGGNSDGDFQMLEWATAGDGPRFGLLVHHTDAEREWAYDRESHAGRLDRGLDEAADRGWLLVDMKKDWRTVYPEAE